MNLFFFFLQNSCLASYSYNSTPYPISLHCILFLVWLFLLFFHTILSSVTSGLTLPSQKQTSEFSVDAKCYLNNLWESGTLKLDLLWAIALFVRVLYKLSRVWQELCYLSFYLKFPNLKSKVFSTGYVGIMILRCWSYWRTVAMI